MMKIIVAGAGLSGLCAAWRLVQAGRDWAVGWTPELNDAFDDRVIGRVAIAGADTSGPRVGGLDGAITTAEDAVRQLLKRVGQPAAVKVR